MAVPLAVEVIAYMSQHSAFNLWFQLTLSRTTNFRPSKQKEFTDDNFVFDENGKKFSIWEENILGKGEIAPFPFPTVFSKDLYMRHIRTRDY